MVKRFPRNDVGRDFVVGDIHGCFSKLEEQLAVLGFNEETDRLFSTGDLVDRGPENERVVEFLRKPWFHSVRGNHDQMLLDGYHQPEQWAACHAMNGGLWFYDLLPAEQLGIVDLFMTLPLAIEVKVGNNYVGIVHAEVPNHDWNDVFDLNEEKLEKLLWSRDKIAYQDNRRVARIDRVYVGHSAGKDVRVLGNVHYIDTGSGFSNGKLTIVEL